MEERSVLLTFRQRIRREKECCNRDGLVVFAADDVVAESLEKPVREIVASSIRPARLLNSDDAGTVEETWATPRLMSFLLLFRVLALTPRSSALRLMPVYGFAAMREIGVRPPRRDAVADPIDDARQGMRLLVAD